MLITLSKPLPLDPLTLLLAEEAALSQRLDALRVKREAIEEQRKKDPQPIDGKQLDALDLDFDALTGKDIEFCARQAEKRKGEMVRVLVIDRDFHLQVASKLTGVGVEALISMGAVDYMEVVTAVQGFLTHSI